MPSSYKKATGWATIFLSHLILLLFLTAPLSSCTGVAAPQSSSQHGEEAVRTLRRDEPLEAELSGTGLLLLSFEASRSQYVRVVVEPSGFLVRRRLVGPDGEEVPAGRCRLDGPTPVSMIAHSTGVHILEIQATDEPTAIGRIRVKIDTQRASTKPDTLRVRAERSFSEGEELRFDYRKESARLAIEKFEDAHRSWQEVNDKAEAALANQRIGGIYEQTGELEKSLHEYRRALQLSREAGNARLESLLLSDVALASVLVGNTSDAADHCQLALTTSATNRRYSGRSKGAQLHR